MPLLVGFTFDLKTGDDRAVPHDLWAEHDDPVTISSVEAALKAGGHNVVRIGGSKELLKKLRRLKCDIVFNIAEGVSGRNRESEVPVLLDTADIPYTGPDALALSVALDKSAAKKILKYHGVPVPGSFEITKKGEVCVPRGVDFPFIVKPRYEGSAKGIRADSVVGDVRALKRRAACIVECYRQPALVEEFIDGWEFTVGVIGNGRLSALPVVQRHVDKRTGLSSHVLKKCGRKPGMSACRELLEIGPALEDRIRELAVKAFLGLECRDFARFDFRVSSKNKNKDIYMLEANPLPSLAKDDYFAMVAELEGITYEDMINRMFAAALERCGLK
ncbi:MAG: ATP-grasp domain-containing protein [Candidatus Omnitrophota bacterium]|jgi:D-alanine-D-alanine ligase